MYKLFSQYLDLFGKPSREFLKKLFPFAQDTSAVRYDMFMVMPLCLAGYHGEGCHCRTDAGKEDRRFFGSPSKGLHLCRLHPRVSVAALLPTNDMSNASLMLHGVCLNAQAQDSGQQLTARSNNEFFCLQLQCLGC